jgi:tetratricopeptide (TPR) repeat protein
MNKLDFAEKYFQQALDICIDNKNKKGIGENTRYLGLVAANYGNLDKAKVFYSEALEIAEKRNDTTQLIFSSISLGNVWNKKNNYEEALHYYYSALVLLEYTACCIEERASVFNNLGVLFSDRGKYIKSLEYYQQAANIYDSLNNQFDLGKTYNNMGNIYWATEEYVRAQAFYEKSLDIRHEQNDKTGEAYVLNNLGMLNGSRGDFVSALAYFEKSLALFESEGNRNGSLLTTYNLAEVYMAMNQYQKAEKHFHQSLAIAQNDGVLNYELDNLKSLTDLYKQSKNYKKAFEVFDRYVALKDSVNTYSNTSHLIEMEASFDQEKKKTTLAFLQQRVDNEKRKANTIRWAIGLMVFVFVSSSIALFFLFRKQNLKAAYQKHQLSQQFLQYQMNPNFLYQSLNYIRDFLYKNKIQEAGAYLSNFARLIRTFIEHSTSEKIGLEMELETIEHYFKLRQAGYETMFSYQIEMDEDLEPEFIQLPPFLLFPFIDILLSRFGLSDTLCIKLSLVSTEKYLQYDADIDFSGSHFLDIDDLKQTLEHVSESADTRVQLIYKLTKQKIDLNYKLNMDKESKKLLLMLKTPLSF